MDSSGPIDDEVIADSECEMDDREEEYPNHPGESITYNVVALYDFILLIYHLQEYC